MLLGREESDLASRALRRGLRVHYAGRALVHHPVLSQRLRHGWLFERPRAEGFTLIVMGTSPVLTTQVRAWDVAARAVLGPSYLAGLANGATFRASTALGIERSSPGEWLSRRERARG